MRFQQMEGQDKVIEVVRVGGQIDFKVLRGFLDRIRVVEVLYVFQISVVVLKDSFFIKNFLYYDRCLEGMSYGFLVYVEEFYT